MKILNFRKSLAILFLLVGYCLNAQDLKVGYLIDKAVGNKEETSAAVDFLKNQHYDVTSLELDEVNAQTLQNFDLIWYHRTDSLEIDNSEKEIGPAITSYVENGGKLILSLEAVKLLNAWGIESTPITAQYADIKDEGFGRKLGFHAFKAHPVFDGLHGGAYIWHAKEDHQVKKLGFFDSNFPQGPEAKIIGIDWAYITYHENSKLLWEYSLGEGKILAVGTYTYFSRPNFHKEQLHRFFTNSIAYLNGDLDNKDTNFWTYTQGSPKQEEFIKEQGVFQAEKTKTLETPDSDMTLSRSVATDNYWDLPGRRLLLMGKEKGGFDELWAHPFMAFRDYSVGVRQRERDSITWLNSLEPEIYFTPGTVIRSYKIGEETLKEIISVSTDKPEMLINYHWTGDANLNIFIKAKSNLRLMWPYSSKATGIIGYQWSESLNALLVSDLKTRSMNAMIGFNQKANAKTIGQFEDFNVNSEITPVSTELNQVAGIFEFNIQEDATLNVNIVAGEESLEDLSENYRNLQASPEKLLEETNHYYENFAEDKLKITTPDANFNEGFKWALAATDQFMVETPGIGKSLVAGYGTTASGWGGGHEISGRPGYAWYFGRDAQWCAFALDAYGDFDKVKDILKTFNKFQNINGKIYHELSTSGSVHYDASDSTPLYILLAAHYLKASGDIDFIKETWPNIQKAIDYCYSTDTDGDGLIETTNVGHGWVEGGDLFGAHTTFYLAGVWTAALKEASLMADVIGNDQLSDKYSRDYNELYKKINADFWNEGKQQFDYGLLKDGSYNKEKTMLPAVPVYFNATDRSNAQKMVEQFAYSDFSTDWGVRIRSEYSEHFSPRGYHTGSVWPLFSGWTSLAEYKTGRYNQGFVHALNNMNVYKEWDLGSVEEVLNGITYQPSGVCRHQGWSETMVLQPLLEGMLGIQPNALNDELGLSPAVPWNWDHLEVENIRVGKHLVDYSYERDEDNTEYFFSHSGPKVLKLNFKPVFPLGTQIDKVVLDGKEIEYDIIEETQAIALKLDTISIEKDSELEIHHELGVGVLPYINHPTVGAESEGLRIINENLIDQKFSIMVEGKPGKEYEMKVFSEKKPRKVQGAVLISEEDNIYNFKVKVPGSSEKYNTMMIDFKVKL